MIGWLGCPLRFLSYISVNQTKHKYEGPLCRVFLSFLPSFSPVSTHTPHRSPPSLTFSHSYTMHHVSSSSSRSLRRASAKAARAVLARGAHKEIRFSNEGRASILKGVDVLANAVSVTLGPKGLFSSVSLCSCYPRVLLTCPVAHRSERYHRAVVRWSQNHQGLVFFLILSCICVPLHVSPSETLCCSQPTFLI
jgi:hypothetical protein